jgi:type IV pilus assembly protein PilA
LLIKEEVHMFKSLLARAREIRAAELEGESGSEGGFTLIELMVVLLIIAILLAIAIPTFLSVSGGARDRAAQSNLTNAVTDSIAYYQNSQTYDASSTTSASQGHAAGSTSVALQSAEPTFTWSDIACTTATASKCVSVAPVDVASTNDGQGIILAAMSATGTCWYALNMQATPAAYVSGGPDVVATIGVFAGQTSIPTTANTAGTFYAKETSAGSSNCTAAHAQTFTTWYSTYSAAVSE